MNKYFINIKVDKEERPDIDRVYMSYVQATTGSGGWPLSVFLTPELHPFLGGTYMPPDDSRGQTGFSTILERVHEFWQRDSSTIEGKARSVLNLLKTNIDGQGDNSATVSPVSDDMTKQVALRLFNQFNLKFDRTLGGFSRAPKFPRPAELQSLFTLGISGLLDDSDSRSCLEMALYSMKMMAQGGIHDHIGGGFCRYSVDEFWHVPHFEKMLYDNAQLLQCFASAYQITHDQFYADIASNIYDYIMRDMCHESGGFYSAQDADSLPDFNATHPKEGAYYVLSKSEIMNVLGVDAGNIFCYHFRIKENGNCDLSPRSDPHGEFIGLNIPIETGNNPNLTTAEHFNKGQDEIESILLESRRKLLSYRREARPTPLLDDKIITSWNGMMISAMAQCHMAFAYSNCTNKRDYLTAAQNGMNVLKQYLVKTDDSGSLTLYRSIRFFAGNEPSSAPGHVLGPFGFADDYAFTIAASLDLYQASGEFRNVEFATALQSIMDCKFKRNNSYLSSDPSDDRSVILQVPEISDGAEPSPNTIALSNLARLGTIFENERDYFKAASALWFWAQPVASETPSALPLLVANSIMFAGGTASGIKIVVLGSSREDPNVKAFLCEAHRRYMPSKTVLLITSQEAHDYFSKFNSTVQGLRWPPTEGRASCHVCAAFVCRPPISDVQDLAETLNTLGAGNPFAI